MNWIDKAFGVHPQVLSVRSQRSSVLAGNMANATTPGFKARDIDFGQALKQAQQGQRTGFSRTNERHIPLQQFSTQELLYRVPTKAVNNGNTVESEVEEAAFSENALRYQTSLEFLNGTIKGLKLAIKGQ